MHERRAVTTALRYEAVIEAAEGRHITLSAPLSYLAPTGLTVEVQNSGSKHGSFTATIDLNAQNHPQAMALVASELDRFANFLSWKYGVSTTFRVTGHAYRAEDGSYVFADHMHFEEKFTVRQTIGAGDVAKIGTFLAGVRAEGVEEILVLWRQAHAQESTVARFFLFYRMLEDIHGGRSAADKWIQKKSPTTPVQDSRGIVSIYTFLRDNIHPKKSASTFPVAEIDNWIDSLEGLLRQAISEKFPELADQGR